MASKLRIQVIVKKKEWERLKTMYLERENELVEKVRTFGFEEIVGVMQTSQT